MIKKFIKNINGETIAEALVTFLISSASIMIIAISIITSQKIINSGTIKSEQILKEQMMAQNYLIEGEESTREEGADIRLGKIEISSDGYLYSDDEIEYFTINNKISAFR